MEEDPLWSPDERESDEAQDIRSKEVLDDVFMNDPNTYLSISSHSGEIGSILRSLFSRICEHVEMLTPGSSGA